MRLLILLVVVYLLMVVGQRFNRYLVKMTLIIFRADGRKKLGMGHIIRCGAIASKLKSLSSNFDIIFVTKYDEGKNLIEELGFDAVKLEDDDVSQLKLLNGDLLINDFLDAEKEIFSELKNQLELKIITIDNNTDLKNIDADVIINANIFSSSEKSIDNKKYLLGPKYMILRESFRNLEVQINEKANSVFIMFGGTDPCGNTIKTLDALISLDNLELNVVLGPGFNSDEELDSLLTSAKATINIFRSPKEIMNIMKQSDIAVLSSGVCLYEMACLGIPSITIPQADHEEIIAKKFNECNICINLERNPDIYSIKKAVVDLLFDYKKRKTLSVNGRSFVDGKGLQRVINEIKILLGEKYV